MRTANGIAHGSNGVTNSYDDSYALLSGSFGADQTAQAVVYRDPSLPANGTHELELLLRFSDDNGNARGYECLFNAYGGYDIVRWNGPFGDIKSLSLTQSGYLGRPLATGDVIKATIIGNVITTYVNGELMARAVDSTFTSGKPGISFFAPAGGNPALLGITSYSVTTK